MDLGTSIGQTIILASVDDLDLFRYKLGAFKYDAKSVYNQQLDLLAYLRWKTTK
jgi:hypothetical protein